jgi:hypothetical protein
VSPLSDEIKIPELVPANNFAGVDAKLQQFVLVNPEFLGVHEDALSVERNKPEFDTAQRSVPLTYKYLM